MCNNLRYFLYLRKSTDREDMQVLSIDGQRTACESYAESNNLFIADTLIEHQSAKHPGRPVFNEMLKRINAGEADGIIAYHPNRLARNSKDGGEIIYWLDLNKIQDLRFPTFWFANDPQGKSMLGIEFAQSKRFSDDLSVVTSRGLLQKCLRGEYPGLVPRGYFNDKNFPLIKVDRQVAPIIKVAFEKFATGTETIETLRVFLAEKGIRTQTTKVSSGGKLLSNETVRKILNNPLYYGAFRYKGIIYQGKHEPIISKELFDRVHHVINVRFPAKRVKAKEKKPFTKLIRCKDCGMFITSENQKGYTYYRCSRKSRQIDCINPFIRAEFLEFQLSALLQKSRIPEKALEEMANLLEMEACQLKSERTAVCDGIREKIKRINSSLELLADGYINQEIERTIYVKKQNQLVSERGTLKEEMLSAEQGSFAWLERFRKWIKTAQTLGKLAETGSPNEKRLIAVEIFGSNLKLGDKILSGEAVNPWNFALQNRSSLETEPLYREVRNWFKGSQD